MLDVLPLAIAAAVIAIVTTAVVLFTLRFGRLLERLNAKQQERQQRAIVERTRRYGQGLASGSHSAADLPSHRQSPPPGGGRGRRRPNRVS